MPTRTPRFHRCHRISPSSRRVILWDPFYTAIRVGGERSVNLSRTPWRVICHIKKTINQNINMNTNEHDLAGKRVAILATDGFEQDELLSPLKALKDANAEVVVVSPTEGHIKGWKGTDWGKKVKVDLSLDEAREEDFDALVLPGGVINPDHLRREVAAVELIKDFFRVGKPVAAICHGPQMLIEADVVRGRKLTSF